MASTEIKNGPAYLKHKLLKAIWNGMTLCHLFITNCPAHVYIRTRLLLIVFLHVGLKEYIVTICSFKPT